MAGGLHFSRRRRTCDCRPRTPIPFMNRRNIAMDQPIWQPSEERVGRANMTAFARQVAAAHGERLRDYGELRAWSVEHPELFWPALWRFAEGRASRPWRAVLEGGDRMPGAKWFVGAELNFAENLLRHRGDRPAIIAWTEDGRRR